MARLTKLKTTPESLGERYEVMVISGLSILGSTAVSLMVTVIPRWIFTVICAITRAGASRPYPAAPAAGFVSAGSSHRTCAEQPRRKGHGIRAR